MVTAPPAIVRPADEFAPDYQPTAADFEEAAIAEAVACPAVRKLLVAAREVLMSNAHGGSMVYLAKQLLPFAGIVADEPLPASVPSSEPPPF